MSTTDLAIASDIGHGAPGLRSNLRPFTDLLEVSSSQKQILVELRGAEIVIGAALGAWGPGPPADATNAVWRRRQAWSEYSTGVYCVTASRTLGGVRRDVCGVKSLSEVLTRVESVALCQATAGTYFYDPDVYPSSVYYDDGVTQYDDGATQYDQEPILYVHLTGGANPNETDVLVQYFFGVGSHTVVQPILGAEKLTGGSLDSLAAWTSGAFGAGGGAVALDTTNEKEGTGCAAITGAFNAAGGQGISQAAMTGAAGKMYRFSGYYFTDETNPAGVEARIRVGYAANYLLSDGRGTEAATAGFALTNTNGYWRRFSFDFVCPGDTAALEVAAFAWNSTGGALSGTVRFDALSLKRIWRFERYQGRIAMDSLPTIEEKRGDSFYAPIAYGSGQFNLINGDGWWEPVLGSLSWLNQEIKVRLGGRFVTGGDEEILFEDCPVVLGGYITPQPSVTDMKCVIPFEDVRVRWQMQVPSRTYDPESPDTTAVAEADKGRFRPILFGSATNVRPARIAKQTGTLLGVGVYELLDGKDVPIGIKRATALYSYLSEEAANLQDWTKRVSLPVPAAGDPMWWSGVGCGLYYPSHDIRVIQVIAGKNDRLDFTYNGTVYKATIAAGLYTWGPASSSSRLETVICTALNAAVGGVPFGVPALDGVRYDLTTGGKVTITCTANTWFPMLGTGANKHRSLWPDLGFAEDTNPAAAASQTSDTAMFTDCDAQVHLRADICGWADAPGVGNVYNLPSQVAKRLLQYVAKVPASAIDTASFTAAETTCPQQLTVYLGRLGENGGAAPLSDIIERIETSANADISWDGEQFHFNVRDNTVPANVTTLTERDYLSFESRLEAEDLYQTIFLEAREDPVTGKQWPFGACIRNLELEFGRKDQRTFRTFVWEYPDVRVRRMAIAAEASNLRRRFKFRTKSRLVRHLIGDKLQLTRAKGWDQSGALSNVLVRILSKTTNLTTFETDVEAIEVI